MPIVHLISACCGCYCCSDGGRHVGYCWPYSCCFGCTAVILISLAIIVFFVVVVMIISLAADAAFIVVVADAIDFWWCSRYADHCCYYALLPCVDVELPFIVCLLWLLILVYRLPFNCFSHKIGPCCGTDLKWSNRTCQRNLVHWLRFQA